MAANMTAITDLFVIAIYPFISNSSGGFMVELQS
jgi:hypothetical protein